MAKPGIRSDLTGKFPRRRRVDGVAARNPVLTDPALCGPVTLAMPQDMICMETDPNRATEAGRWWWEVAVPEILQRAEVSAARKAYEQGKQQQKT